MASRRNSQIFCWLTQDADPVQELPTPFPSGLTPEDIEGMTDEEVKQLAKTEVDGDRVISFNKAKENSVIYEALPEGFDAKQLQMSHPNTNVQTMVDWLANRCAASMGLSKVFATGDAHDSDYKANKLFSWPAIEELQKDIEQICDWVFYRFANWSVKKGISGAYLSDDFMDYVDWEWRRIDDISPVEHENGVRLALANNTTTYKEILGNNWKEKLEQTAYEHKWMSEHGICHPSEKMISGGQTRQSEKQVEEPTTSEEEI